MKPGLDGTVTPNASATVANVGSTNDAPGTNASMMAQKPATYAAQVTSDQPIALKAGPGCLIVSMPNANSCHRATSGSANRAGSQSASRSINGSPPPERQ